MCLCSFSTKETRAEGGIKVIHEMIKKLEGRHAEHIDVYGEE
jgi:glutamine synthetase